MNKAIILDCIGTSAKTGGAKGLVMNKAIILDCIGTSGTKFSTLVPGFY